MGALNRYHHRRRIWKQEHRVAPSVRHHAWWLLHNCVSHPWLGVRPSRRAVAFHDWTSKHLNCRDHIRPSPMPQIGNPAAWAWHNIAGHMAIGLLPVKASFDFHDRGAEAMKVPHWV